MPFLRTGITVSFIHQRLGDNEVSPSTGQPDSSAILFLTGRDVNSKAVLKGKD
jgi:hypothetical protein